MNESDEKRDPGYEEHKPPEEPHPDEPRGTSLPPAEDPATQPDPEEGEPAGEGEGRPEAEEE